MINNGVVHLSCEVQILELRHDKQLLVMSCQLYSRNLPNLTRSENINNIKTKYFYTFEMKKSGNVWQCVWFWLLPLFNIYISHLYSTKSRFVLS